MIRRIGLCQRGELVGVGLPVKASGIDDHTAKRSAVSAEKLRRRMNHHISTVLYRPYYIWRAERIVYQQRQTVGMSHIGYCPYVDRRRIGIAQRLDKHSLSIGSYCLLDILRIGRIHKCRGDTV